MHPSSALAAHAQFTEGQGISDSSAIPRYTTSLQSTGLSLSQQPRRHRVVSIGLGERKRSITEKLYECPFPWQHDDCHLFSAETGNQTMSRWCYGLHYMSATSSLRGRGRLRWRQNLPELLPDHILTTWVTVKTYPGYSAHERSSSSKAVAITVGRYILPPETWRLLTPCTLRS